MGDFLKIEKKGNEEQETVFGLFSIFFDILIIADWRTFFFVKLNMFFVKHF